MSTATLAPSSTSPNSSSNSSPTAELRAELEADWRLWLVHLFRPYVSDATGRYVGFGTHHADFWEWVWSIRPGERPPPFAAIWPRGGGKSTAAELACVAIGAMGLRRYGLYVSETQDQADDHVSNVAAMLESTRFGQVYPRMAERLVGKYGNSRGWRRNRLRTAAGFTVDALGLDSASRGLKLEADRPDFLVLDDLDGELDSLETTEKKIKLITRKLLPAGASDLAVLAVQNLVHRDSIFAQLADGRADFLTNRVVSGPHAALADLAYETHGIKTTLTRGAPLWEGQNRARCQEMVDDMGISAFLAECQHDVHDAGGIFDRVAWARFDPTMLQHRGLKPSYIYVDTAAKTGLHNDYSAASVWGELDGCYYVLDCWNDKKEYPDLKAQLRDLYETWRVPLVIEDTSAGQSLIQDLRRPERNLQGDVLPAIPVVPYKVGVNGVMAQATVASAYVNGGLVHVPDDAPWVAAWINQHAAYPQVSHDDMVATTAMALTHLPGAGRAGQQLAGAFGRGLPLRYGT